MVSFQCDGCADTIKKPKLDQHRNRCWSTFTCIDCSTTFQGTDYRSHTSCISEAEKYEKTLYKGKKSGGQGGQAGNNGKPKNQGKQFANGNGHGEVANDVSAEEASSPSASASASAPAASASAIHPSRSRLIQNGENSSGRGSDNGSRQPQNRHATFPQLHPGSRYSQGQQGRGGRSQQGPSARNKMTGANNFEAKSGMRSWGSTPQPETEGEEEQIPSAAVIQPAPAAAVVDKRDKNKKKKKGDKGGTGSKANSNKGKNAESETKACDSPAAATSETSTTITPAADKKTEESSSSANGKKRKADASGDTPTPVAGESSTSDRKLAKRLRKSLSSLASSTKSSDSSAPELPLSQFLTRLADGIDKKGKGGKEDVMENVKVAWVPAAEGKEGHWAIQV